MKPRHSLETCLNLTKDFTGSRRRISDKRSSLPAMTSTAEMAFGFLTGGEGAGFSSIFERSVEATDGGMFYTVNCI